MNPEEQRRLTQFLDELGKVRGVPRDPEADALIGAATRQQPDAVYLLVQRCLLQDQALQAANARIEALQQSLAQARPPRPEGGLLGANPWGRASPPSPPPAGMRFSTVTCKGRTRCGPNSERNICQARKIRLSSVGTSGIPSMANCGHSAVKCKVSCSVIS